MIIASNGAGVGISVCVCHMNGTASFSRCYDGCLSNIYIYIYRERERERERYKYIEILSDLRELYVWESC